MIYSHMHNTTGTEPVNETKDESPMGTRRKPPHTAAFEKWTWQQAEEALAKSDVNRNLRQPDIDKYARAMEKKLWGMCVAPVVFDWDEKLVDGNHRLNAQVQSRATIEWLVYRNLPPKEQVHIDTGLARSAADRLKYAGYGNYIVLASVARWAQLLEEGKTSAWKHKVSPDEIEDMVRRHDDLQHSAVVAMRARTGLFQSILGPTPLAAAHWWIAQSNDHEEADLFLERFKNMHQEQPGSAILALFTRLSSARQQRELIQTRVQIAMIIKAWNLDVERTFVHRIASKSKTGEYLIPQVEKRIESQNDAFGPLTDPEEALEEQHQEMDEGEGRS